MAKITTEGTTVSPFSDSPNQFPVTGSGHLLLVFEDDLGNEFVIRGGPNRPDPPNSESPFGNLTLQINLPIDDSVDQRVLRDEDNIVVTDENGNPVPVTPEFRGSTLVSFSDDRLPENVWEILQQHAFNIDGAEFPYSPLGFNSNGTVGNLLDVVGINIDSVLPNPEGVMVLPFSGKNKDFEFDYILSGTDGKDLIRGRKGSQTFFGFEENDTLAGGQDDDILDGGGGNDVLDGGGGNDMLQGGEGNDILEGGGIQDIFNPTQDTAVFSGSREDYDIETSNDIFGITEITTVTHLNGGSDGVDTLTNIEFLQFSDGTIPLPLAEEDNPDEQINFTGGAGNHNLIGNNLNNIITGEAGNDRLEGRQGNDTITGGNNNDTLKGEDSNDSLNGGADIDL